MKRIRLFDKPPGFPCYHCGVRPDVGCAHRPPDPGWSMGPAPPVTDQRSLRGKAARRSGNWSLDD